MEPVTTYAGRLITARNWNDTRDARHRPMERRIEARDLQHGGMPFGEDLHQPDFEREMLWIERNGPPQIGHQFRSDQFWRAVLHAMDDPMADGLDRSELWLCTGVQL